MITNSTCGSIMKLFFGLAKFILSTKALQHKLLNSFWRHCRVAATKSIAYPKNSLSTLPGIAGLHFKFAASSVLYANEKNIHYDPDYLSGLSRARSRVFSDNLSRNSCTSTNTTTVFNLPGIMRRCAHSGASYGTPLLQKTQKEVLH